MLPKEQRIASDKDFKRVYQRGSFFSTSLYGVNFLPNRMSFSRLGIVVSKKTEPKAVNRNKLKRQFREASKKIYHNLPTGYDFVINIKSEAKKVDFAKIQKSLESLAERVKK